MILKEKKKIEYVYNSLKRNSYLNMQRNLIDNKESEFIYEEFSLNQFSAIEENNQQEQMVERLETVKSQQYKYSKFYSPNRKESPHHHHSFCEQETQKINQMYHSYSKSHQTYKKQYEFDKQGEHLEAQSTAFKDSDKQYQKSMNELRLKHSYSGFSDSSSCYDLNLSLLPGKSFCEERQKMVNMETICFLKPDQLNHTIAEMIYPLQQRMVIDKHLIMYLLYKHSWKQEKLDEKYYGHQEQIFRLKDDLLKMKEHQKPPVRKKNNSLSNAIDKKTYEKQTESICPICLTSDQLIKADLCEHAYCLQCWRKYIKQQLSEGFIFFSCMDNCVDCPILETFVENYFPEMMEIYQQKIGINYCLANTNISFCPNQKCQIFCRKPVTMTVKKVECQCGNVYCFYCRKECHYPLTCESARKWEQIVNKESNNNEWILKNTTICPRCRSNVQKSIGCDYIKCVCGCQFCFSCSKQWDQSHKSQLKCASKQGYNKHMQIEEILQQKFEKVYQSVFEIGEKIKKDSQVIQKSKSLIRQQNIYERLKQIGYELKQSWLLHKWIKIGQFLFKTQVQKQLSVQFQKSMGNLIDTVKCLEKGQQKLSMHQIHRLSEEVIRKRQNMQKCRHTYETAWEGLNFF